MRAAAFSSVLLLTLLSTAAIADPALHYKEHCAACHADNRSGGMGPALLPQSLERLKKAEAQRTITEGRIGTQMPAFADKLFATDIKALSEWLYTPAEALDWTEAQIRASRIQVTPPSKLANKPQFTADPMNLFVVVEGGDHHASILDGDKLEVMHRFPTRYALHGGPKFSPDGRFVYFASRDGWISKFDLWNLKLVAEIRAGINTRNAAVSADGRHVMVANTLPANLVVLDANLRLVKTLPATSADGKQSSRVSAVYDATPRQSFVAAMKDMPEIWEISYAPRRGGKKNPDFLQPRRTQLDAVLDDFFFDQAYQHVMGTARDGQGQVVDLDQQKKVGALDLSGMPHLGSGITWQYQGRTVMASTNLRESAISVIDMQRWEKIADIKTGGPGFFLRSHEKSRYAFADSMMSREAKDTLYVIDKQSLEVVKTLRPEPGKTLAHIEFTRNGRYALASLWEMDGALIIYDAVKLEEVKRLPMKKPVGKYNVWNKITRSEGTSH